MESHDDNEQILRPGQSGGGKALTHVGFGTQTFDRPSETQGSALAERAKAEVQARYIMALQRPRNIEEVRVRLLEHCKRTGFAVVAEYAKPVGGTKITGPSIRFVETALQEYGNVLPDATVIYDDDEKRVMRISVTDLERNITYNDEAVVEKFVERKSPKKGDEIIGSRTNSQGDQVYRIRATEDDFANKCAAQVSKKTRNQGLRILPADIVDEAMWTCSQTRQKADNQNPAAARRWVIDKFAEIRVMPTDLDDYLGHSFEQASPAELDELRAVYATIRDGETNWPALIEMQRTRRGEVEKPSDAAKESGDKLKAKIEQVRAKAKAKEQAAPATDKAAAQLTDDEKRAIENQEREEARK